MTSVDGLISGLNTTEVIEGLLSFQRRPITRLERQIEAITTKKAAITAISAQLLSFQLKARSLSRESTFNAVTVTSSDDTVLTARGSSSLAPGSYRFKIRQLAQVEQYTSTGFSSATDKVGAGTLSIETGNGFVDRKTDLDLLNGGSGVRRGSIRITNRLGQSGIVDLSTAITIDDVVETINNQSGINVTARIAGVSDTNPRGGIVLVDSSGGTGNFKVDDISGGATARDLGIYTPAGVAANEIQGTTIVKLGNTLRLSALNDGLGVRIAAGNDLTITTRDNSTVTIDLSDDQTIGDLIQSFVDHGDGKVTLSISADAQSLILTDTTAGATTLPVASSDAANDLGIAGFAVGGAATITGDRILSDLNSVLLKTLNGTSTFTGGSLTITNRNGVASNIDLSTAKTLAEAIDTINANATDAFSSYNAVGNGLLLTDTTGGSQVFKVEESGGGTVAAQLGILEATGVSSDTIAGTDLNPQYIGTTTRLSTLNGGRGVATGSIRITDAQGASFEVPIGDSVKTLADVIVQIEGKRPATSNLTVGINSRGNGLVIGDTSTSGSLLKVEEINAGTTAKDLGILGADDPTNPTRTIDGSFEKTITISATDTLEDVEKAIEDLDIRVSVSIANDGSFLNPFRLQVSGDDPGSLGRVVVDSTGTNITFGRTSSARDATLFYGSSEGGSQPVLVRSRDNTFRDVIEGLSVTAVSASTEEVNVSATPNRDAVKETIASVVETYNGIVADIRDLTRFDPETGDRGILIGDSVLRRIERDVWSVLTRRVLGLPPGKSLPSNFGLRFEGNGSLSFNQSEFDTAIAEDPDAALRLFTRHRPLDSSVKLSEFDNGRGVPHQVGSDIKITTRDGSIIKINSSGASTVAGLLKVFNDAKDDAGDENQISLAISGDGRSLVLTDNTTGGGALKVESLLSSTAFKAIGLNKPPDIEGGAIITGNQIDLSSDPGVALTLEEILDDLLDTEDGAITLRADSFQDEIEDLQTEIARREELFVLRETRLRQEFAQLEVLLGRNQNTQARLGAALNAIPSIVV